MSELAPSIYLNTHVIMLWVYRHYTHFFLSVWVYRRQILTYIDCPRAGRVKLRLLVSSVITEQKKFHTSFQYQPRRSLLEVKPLIKFLVV